MDEAHNCAPSGRGKYATDSLRTEALRLLAPHFEHKLFLTATPHNGYPESFSALLELLDNQRFARGTPPDRKQLDAVMVRRLKSELPPKWDGSPRFPKRVLEPLEVAYTDEEQAIHAALRQYAELRPKRARGQRREVRHRVRAQDAQEAALLQPGGLPATLEQHETVAAARPSGARPCPKPSVGILQRELDRIDEDYADDDEYDEATDDAVDAASRLFREPTDEELALLKQMKAWAETGVGPARLQGAGADRLAERAHPARRASGRDERVIIFTEYRATQNWLQEVLAPEGFTGRRPAADHVRRHGPGRPGGGSRRRSRPTRSRAPSASCWPPTPPPRGSTSRTTAPG